MKAIEFRYQQLIDLKTVAAIGAGRYEHTPKRQTYRNLHKRTRNGNTCWRDHREKTKTASGKLFPECLRTSETISGGIIRSGVGSLSPGCEHMENGQADYNNGITRI